MNLQVAFLTLVMALISKATSKCNPEPPCKDPDDLDIQLLKARGTAMLSVMEPWSKPSGTFKSNCTLISQTLDTDKECPPSMQSLDRSLYAMMKDRSTCPFFRVLETDPSRYPRTQMSARCRCRKCLGKSGQTDDTVCEPQYVTEVVLQRGECKNGVYEYHSQEVQRAIACMCAIERNSVSSNNDANVTGLPQPIA